jgi:hypothetical protein
MKCSSVKPHGRSSFPDPRFSGISDRDSDLSHVAMRDHTRSSCAGLFLEGAWVMARCLSFTEKRVGQWAIYLPEISTFLPRCLVQADRER